eukprot:5918674-Amphidinium_carterae.1
MSTIKIDDLCAAALQTTWPLRTPPSVHNALVLSAFLRVSRWLKLLVVLRPHRRKRQQCKNSQPH